jgi:hypothetical protein
VDALLALGILPRHASIPTERLWDFFTLMFRSIASDEPLRITRRMVGDAFRQVAMPDSEYRDLQQQLEFPAMLAMFQRYVFGTSAVLGHLEAEANWHRIIREMLFGDEPTTAIGRAW